ncbi:unnamed protein product [Cuscuta campestris]|uniref:Proteasome-associated protein ECM29 homolog n=1 Tax=Cuscuta campestris TaxID=132261 RepID=A0A484M935_9ASTE|nr:unnamed protein product [Cuscuta campestris]
MSSWSAALSGKSDAEKEEMLDRMLTRLALCNDSKLQDLLSKLLPLSIASLSSPSTPLRNKVIEILSHVNKRVKFQPYIGLPLSELWKLYVESNAFSMVRNFSIVYFEMAVERAPKEEKENTTLTLLASISKVTPQHQEILLRIITKVIGDCHSTHLDDEVVAKYRKLGGFLHDNKTFLEFCLHMVLYQPTTLSGACPAGLSPTQCDRVTGKQQLTNDTLCSRKMGILNIIEAMEIAVELVYPIYIAACADSQELIAKKGDDLLKKKATTVNVEDLDMIKKLFFLFNGTTGSEQIPPESKVAPVHTSLKVRLMSVFCRSISAANSFPSTLQCIFGCIYGNNTTSRLKQLGMEFSVWVFKHARMEQLKLMGPIILSGILKSFDGYSASDSDAISRERKAFAFQAVGLIALRMPQLFRDKIDIAVRLFDALQYEDQFLRLNIQEATNSLAVAYKDAPPDVLKALESLLLKSSKVEQSEVRFCAIRWATSLFDMQHCPSRFICMLGAADPKLDIREIALEGLCLNEGQRKSVSQNHNLQYPKLPDILGYIIEKHPGVLDPSNVGGAMLFPSKTYIAMIKFLLKCFEVDAQQSVLLEDSEFLSSVDQFCLLLEHAMVYEASVELLANASNALIIIASYTPQVISSRYVNKVSWLKQYLGHIDSDTRESMSRILGIASCELPIHTLSTLVHELISAVSSSSKFRFEMTHGHLCALGYITANSMSRTPCIPGSLFESVLKCLTNVVSLEAPSLASVAMQALGHIGLSFSLSPFLHDTSPASVLTILNEKLIKLLSSDDIKAGQRIVISLGHMSFKESSAANLNNALDLIFSLCHSKVEDILFAAGEALAFLWGGVPVTPDTILKTNYTSLSTSSNFLMGNISSSLLSSSSMDFDKSNDHDITRDAITRKLFDVLLFSSRKEERCAGTVWLLSLTIYCGHHPTIQKLLPDIQEAFSHLLADQNELIQELASQGLSIVYEIGDASMKKNLVDALVGTLTGSGKRKRAVKINEDSEVFQEGLIGESPTGGKLSTYKELCNLANEMGKPDLIYKFMDLANYQSSLNSKRGAAFGFSKIAKYAGDALQPYLCTLIPRLLRYQYDPDKNVQDAMTHIWRSLVGDSKSTIDEHFDLIVHDLLVQSGSRLWRSREASCLALSDILQGRRFDQVNKYLKRIWSTAFRAMDDIKESVRNAGDRLCRAVTSLTQRLCDISLTEASDAKLAMDIVLPLLITDGIMSKVENIRKASIGVITKLAKSAGISLRPHLPDLVCCMLESLSSLEDQGLNYVELHAANVGIQTEKLENLRISMAKSSPMWETLERCIDIIDSGSLELLIPRIVHLVRVGVGLNTRVGVANFLSSLVQKVGNDIKPFISMLLKLLLHVVTDEKSATAKRGFSNACATVLKYASPTLAQKLIEDTAALQSGDRNSQISCAILLKSYSSNATDILSRYSAITVPVVFISRFEDDKIVSNLYQEMWEENMNSERVTLQLYLDEIVNLLNEGIMSSSWSNKRKAAHAIRKLCEILGNSVSSHHHLLLTPLMKEIPGRLWEGKEALLYALSSLCKSCYEAISAANPESPNSILDLISNACTKKTRKYQEAAFDCLEQVIKAFDNPDFFSKVFPMLCEMCCSTSSSDVKTDEEENFSAGHDKIVNCITASIHVAQLDDIIQHRKNMFKVFLVSLTASIPWIVKIAVFTSVTELCSKIHEQITGAKDSSLPKSIRSFVHELFSETSSKVLNCIRTIKIAQVHIAAAECLVEITDVVAYASPEVQLSETGFIPELLQVIEMEKNELAKSSLKKCMDNLQTLQKKQMIFRERI